MSAYIEKEAAIDALKQLPHEYGTKEQRARTGGIAACQMVVRGLPPADVRPVVRGKWMHRGIEQYKCSICRFECYVPECMGEPMYTYCPNCGADMREETIVESEG